MATQEEPQIRDDDLSFLASFFKNLSLEEIRNRVLKIWRDCNNSNKAIYICIKELMFIQPRIQNHPFYNKMIASSKDRTFLDLGCCFGTDTRKLILDGWNDKNITAIDITDDYWNLGFDLYADKQTLGVTAMFGNLVEQEEFAKDLAGHFDYVWTGLVLHVLSKIEIELLMKRILGLLKPGGTYFGTCVGSPQPGEWVPTPSGKAMRWLHSKESLQQVLEDAGFVDVVVEEHPFTLFEQIPGAMKRYAERNPDIAKRERNHLCYSATKALSQ